jgi:hypothetical protein
MVKPPTPACGMSWEGLPVFTTMIVGCPGRSVLMWLSALVTSWDRLTPALLAS